MDNTENFSFKRKPRKCPACGSKKIASIIYGFPSKDMQKDVESGKYVLGGCCVSGDDPSWKCIGLLTLEIIR